MTSLAESLTLESLERDPDPILAQLRDDAPVAFSTSMNLWLVTRWDDVETMDRHPEIFSATTEPSFLRRALGVNMLTLDAPEAARLKNAMMPPFQRSGYSGKFAEEMLPALSDALIDGFYDDGRADVVSPYAAAVSAGSLKTSARPLGQCLTTSLGVVRRALRRHFEFRERSREESSEKAKRELEVALDGKIDELRETTSDTAIAHMLAVDAEGKPLTREEIINNVRLMISGGINEPRDGIGLAAWMLLKDPELREQVVSEPKL